MTQSLYSLKTRLSLFFGLAVLAVGLPTYLYLDQVYMQKLRDDKAQALQSLAISVAAVLSENLRERQREISLLAAAPYLESGPIDATQLQRVLDRLKQSYAHYAWIGYADLSGQVVAASNGLLVGADVSQRPWFIEGQKGQYVGDLHKALLLSKHMPQPPDGRAIRFIDFTAPVLDEASRLRGVLAAHAHWAWAEDITTALKTSKIATDGIDLLIIGNDGTIIYPEKAGEPFKAPTQILDKTFAIAAWNDDIRYASAIANINEPLPDSSLGWKVVARQPENGMLADLHDLKQLLLVVVLIATLILFTTIVWISSRLSRPVEQLSRFAKRIEAGDENTDLTMDADSVEVQQTLASVQKISRILIERKQALTEANLDLENKIAMRTAELREHKLHLEDLVLARTQELASARDVAEAANRAKNFLLSNMSHELRTPLNHIMGMNTLLKREVTSKKGLDRIDKINQASLRLLRLVNNLLDTVQTETSQLVIRGSDFELAGLLQSLEDRNRTALNEKSRVLVQEVAGNVPACLHGDPQRIIQILSELLDNAVKFSDAGPVFVRVSAKKQEGSFHWVRFEIEDTGIGIPLEIQAVMFDMFSQGDPSSTRKYGGVGLGLLLSKRLVDLMAGEIGFSSKPDGGSIFWIEIPLTKATSSSSSENPGRANDWSALGPVLERLITQLEEDDFTAQQTWAELAPRAGHLLNAQRQQFETAINEYDLVTALKILKTALASQAST